MPFVPHTQEDEQIMLEAIGVPSIDSLFDEIPTELRSGVLKHTPDAITEMELMRLMGARARQDEVALSFLGAGAYQHHIPAAVWDLVSRGEFLTAYTPYQAEASQGTLQIIYEFQSMMARLTAMDVANASVYDGGSALAEAILMAVRANKSSKSRRILCAGTVNPRYLSAARNIVRNQGIELETVDFSDTTGILDVSSLDELAGDDYAALVISMPNFFGCLEAVDELTNRAHEMGALLVGVVNPTSLALLRPPGEWGETGADIVVGEGQPLGIPVASGGPYLGFMCCRQSLVRQMPGRIIGKTVDLDGKVGYALTLQAREQHIRRAKATSNICTNQGLLVTAATIYMSLMGDDGLRSVAIASHQGTLELLAAVTGLEGVDRKFTAPVFHEAVIETPVAAAQVLERMAEQGILGGLDLCELGLERCILINVTEMHTTEDIETYAACLRGVLEGLSC